MFQSTLRSVFRSSVRSIHQSAQHVRMTNTPQASQCALPRLRIIYSSFIPKNVNKEGFSVEENTVSNMMRTIDKDDMLYKSVFSSIFVFQNYHFLNPGQFQDKLIASDVLYHHNIRDSELEEYDRGYFQYFSYTKVPSPVLSLSFFYLIERMRRNRLNVVMCQENDTNVKKTIKKYGKSHTLVCNSEDHMVENINRHIDYLRSWGQ